MKVYLLKVLIAVLPFFILSDNIWKVKNSTITFKIKNAGLNVNGSFSRLTADIKFDPQKPEESLIIASVNSSSVNTDNDMRDGHLKKEEYFDVERFPKITMSSVKIIKTGPITYNGIFKLEMKGVIKEVLIPFTFMKLPDKTELKGTFTINRRDYGIGGNSITLADDVTINILLTLTE